MATNSQSQETAEYRTFREHYDNLYHAIQDPLSLANRLFSEGIIASAVNEQMSVSATPRLDKNNALLRAVEMQIRTNPSTLQVFLSILNEDPSVQSLVQNMQAGYISNKFTTLHNNVCTKMIQNGVDVEEFRFFAITSFPPGDVIPLPPTTLTEIFKAITHHHLWDYFHYSPLERIVSKFGAGDPEMETWVQNYREDFSSYISTVQILDYIEPNPTTRCSLHYCCPVEWKITFANNTLQYLYDMWELFSAQYLEPDPPLTSLLECVHDVESSTSATVTWLVPSYLIPQLIKKVKVNTTFLQKRGIWNVIVADQCIYDEQEALDNTTTRLEGLAAMRQGYGRFPSITLNNNNIIVAVRNSLVWFTLKSRVGVVSEGDTIHWGDEEDFGYGYFPRVSLNNNNVIVEVHESQYWRTLWYRVGKVDVTSRTINWGGNQYFGEGRAPAVAITDSNHLVVVYENAYGFHKSYYRVGTLNTEHKRIEWASEAQFYGFGQELSVAMNNDGTVIEVHRSPFLFRLRLTVGRLSVNNQGNVLGTVDWRGPKTYSHGFYPYISLNGDGKVVEVHQSLFFRRLAYRTGIANRGANAFRWSRTQRHYGLGWAPVVALNDRNKVVECHETDSILKGNFLWYKIGSLRDLL